MEGPLCRRNTGRGWSGDSDSPYHPLPVGPCLQGYRKERMEVDSPRSRLPAVPPTRRSSDTNKGPPRFCPHSPRLRKWGISELMGPIVPTATLVLLARPPYRRWTLTFIAPPNPPCPIPHTVTKPQQKLVTV